MENPWIPFTVYSTMPNMSRRLKGPRDYEERAKYVYVLARGDDVCKIGVSNKPAKRMSSIQAAQPEKIELFHYEKHPDIPALYIEQGALCLMKRWKMSGEWIAAPASVGVMAVEAARTGELRLVRYIELLQQWREAEDEAEATAARWSLFKHSRRDDEDRIEMTRRKEAAWRRLLTIKQTVSRDFADYRQTQRPKYEGLPLNIVGLVWD